MTLETNEKPQVMALETELNPKNYLYGEKDVSLLKKFKSLISPNLWARMERRLRKDG